jgi:hypothetical protein
VFLQSSSFSSYQLEIPRLGGVLCGYMSSGYLAVNAMLSYDVAATGFKNANS